MADDADSAQDELDRVYDVAKQHFSKLASEIPAGEPGECERCGEFSLRLVEGACAPCRDKYKLR
jgi:hypothetical protein